MCSPKYTPHHKVIARPQVVKTTNNAHPLRRRCSSSLNRSVFYSQFAPIRDALFLQLVILIGACNQGKGGFRIFNPDASLVDTRSVDFFRMHAYSFLIETKKSPTEVRLKGDFFNAFFACEIQKNL